MIPGQDQEHEGRDGLSPEGHVGPSELGDLIASLKGQPAWSPRTNGNQ